MARISAYKLASILATASRSAPSNKAGGIIPRDTGLLQDSSINALALTPNSAVVAIGGEEGSLASYAPITNNKWVSPKWGDKQNPNEGWIVKMVEELWVPELKAIYNATEIRVIKG